MDGRVLIAFLTLAGGMAGCVTDAAEPEVPTLPVQELATA